MPKIRGVKPDYWTDEDIVELSIPARLLFIGLWNYACDNGHLPDKPKQIKMRVFPGDDVNVAELLRELEGSGRIKRANGWATIPKFAHHQKPNRRFWLTCEMPGCAKPAKDSQPETPSDQGEPSLPNLSQERPPDDGDCEVDGDGDGDVMVSSTALAVVRSNQDEASAQTLVAEWIEHCPSRPPGRVIGQVAKELKTMLSEGVDPARVRSGLAEWNTRGLHPSTLPSVVHELANRKPRVDRRQAEADDLFKRAAERIAARGGNQ